MVKRRTEDTSTGKIIRQEITQLPDAIREQLAPKRSTVQITGIPPDPFRSKKQSVTTTPARSTIKSWSLDKQSNQIVITRSNGSTSSFPSWYSITDLPKEEVQQLLNLKLQNATEDAELFILDLKGQFSTMRK